MLVIGWTAGTTVFEPGSKDCVLGWHDRGPDWTKFVPGWTKLERPGGRVWDAFRAPSPTVRARAATQPRGADTHHTCRYAT